MNEYQLQEHNKKVALVNELNTLSGLTFKLEVKNDNEDVRLDGEVPIMARGKDYRKQYSFFLWYQLPYVRYDTYHEVEKKYKKPNEIGVLNKNKILAWVEYLTKIYQDLQKISQERVNTITQFEADVIKNGGTIGKKDEYYHTFEGEIVKNGVLFKFTVHDEGYISKNIEIYYGVADTIENFIKLSDNKYR